MTSSVLPMIDLSSGDDDEVDFQPYPCRSSDDTEDPHLLFGNGNLCRSTLSINQISMTPSPFSDVTVSSQRPLVPPRAGSISSEHNALLKEATKKKPVADIAHVSFVL
uniref:CACTA en-spm transposon protein n=1 Tax=Caenorhabditis tropicalis TaxID=1561998 RepID=A0A1I7SXX5_9PELO